MSVAWRLPVVLVILLLGTVASVCAETRYVSDQLVVSLRQAPEANAERITFLRTNAAVEVLETLGQHLKVRTKAGEVGYVQAQYLTAEIPKTTIIARLEKERDRLQGQIAALEKDLSLASSQGDEAQQKMVKDLRAARELASKLQKDFDRTQGELNKVSKAYQELQKNSKNVVAITTERDNLTVANQELTTKLVKLEEDRDSLLKTGAIKWFFAGAGVLFIGWIIGKMSGGRRRRSAF